MTDPAPPATERATFFRQSGWMMLATLVGGVLAWAVHLLSKAIPPSEYGTLITLLSVVNLVPTLPLQMVFAQQTARAVATGQTAPLAGLIRWTGLGIFLVCALGAAGVWGWHQTLALKWHLANPAALPGLLVAILLSLSWPVFAGIMQGRQNFLWAGWGTILNGAVRLTSAALIVLVWNGRATGILVAFSLGWLAASLVGAAQTRAQWRAPAGPFDHQIFRRQILPLMLGFAATQFLFSADTVFVNFYFGADQTAPYGAAGTLSRALLWVVLPLAGVMFPKIVRSHVASERNNLSGVTLLLTAALAGAGFLGLWVLGPWLVPLIFPAGYSRDTLAVLLWYAGAMIPLALANVLVNDLLARFRFKLVPPLLLLAAGYGVALTRFHDTPKEILQILGGFNLLLLAVCAWFASRAGAEKAEG